MKCAIVVLLACSSLVLAGNPGLRVRVTDQFLEAVKDIIRQVAQKQVGQLPKQIPAGALPSGMRVTNIRVKEHQMDNADIAFEAPNHLKFSSVAGRAILEGTLKKRTQRGTVTATLTGINLDLALAFGRSATNRLHLTKSRCQLSIDTVELTVDGFSENPEVEQFAQQVAQQAKALLPAMLCPQLEMGLVVVSARLGMMPTSVPLFRGLAFDLALVNDPIATSDYLQFDLSGCTHAAGEQSDDDCAHYTPSPLVETADNSRMFYVWSSEQLSNQFLSQYHKHGLSAFTLTKDSKPEWYARAKKHLQKCASDIGKELKDEDDVEITIKTAEAPTINMKANPEKPKAPITVNLKLEVSIKVRPGAADEKVITGVLAAKGNVFIKLNATKEGDLYPKFDEKVVLTELTVEELSGIEMTDEQKTAIAEKAKSRIQRYINKKINKVQEYDNQMMKRMASMGRIENAYMKVNDRTFEIGFDIGVNVDNVFAYVERRRGPAKGF